MSAPGSGSARESPRAISSWLNVLAKLSAAGFSFLLLIMLARSMTPVAFADLSVILAWLAIATAIAGYSMPLLSVRFVAENLAHERFGAARGVVLFALKFTAVASVAVVGLAVTPILLGWIALPRDLESSLIWLALLLPVSVLLTVAAGLLQGLKRVITAELASNASRPLLIMIAVALCWHLGYTPLGVPLAVAIYWLVAVLILLLCLALGFRHAPRAMRAADSQYEPRLWFRVASGFMAVTLTAAVNERLDILVMSWLAQPEEIATYAVAVRFSQTVLAATIAVSAVMAPYLAERLGDLHGGAKRETNLLIQQTARTILLVAILALAGFATLGPPILMLFGSHYGAAYTPLLILAGGLVAAALFGPALHVAMFIGQTRIAVTCLAAGMICNACLSLWLTPIHGAVGAAAATAGGMIVAAASGYVWLLKRSGLNAAAVARRVEPGEIRHTQGQ